MKAIYFVIIFTLISCKEKGYIDYSEVVTEQQVYYYKDDGGLVNGKVKMFFDKGFFDKSQLMQEFKLKDGKKQDTSSRWHNNGRLNFLEYYDDGKRQGSSKSWYSNGVPQREFFYIDDKVNGTAKTWHSNGQLQYSKEYKDGILHGESKEWSEDGRLFSQQTYFNGEKHGLEIIKHFGTQWSRLEGNYINGKKVGEHKEFGMSNNVGVLERSEFYKYDLKEFIPEGKIEDDLFSYLMGNSWTCNGYNVTFNRTDDDSGDVIFRKRSSKLVKGVFIIKPEDPSKITIFIRKWDFELSRGETRYVGEMSCWLDREGNIKGNSNLFQPTYHTEFGELLAPNEVLIERHIN
jgi:antitoxin component YwqK of YwqJK toxin-antitoxin module